MLKNFIIYRNGWRQKPVTLEIRWDDGSIQVFNYDTYDEAIDQASAFSALAA